jgi:hypothetical protein
VSAEIVRLDNFRRSPADDEPQMADDSECDLATAIDVAIRDLREILRKWGSEGARARALECERMLARVQKHGVTPSQ